ncbi:hypothetical protein ScPMuIL_002883 [Solemya velum]
MSITSFFKRQTLADDSMPADGGKKARIEEKERQPVPVTATLKTVQRWEKELNITLGKVVDRGNVCTEIWCECCRTFAVDHTSNFVTGNQRVKKEGVKYHKDSTSHKDALHIKSASLKRARSKATPFEKSLMKMDEVQMAKMEKLFTTAYYLAINERPFSDFPKLLELQAVNGLSLGETYFTDKAAKEFVGQIAGSYFDELKSCLDKTPFLSIFSDGSTDRTESEKKSIMVKVLDDFYPVVKYLKLKEPENTKSLGILDAIDKAFSDFDMEDYHRKTVGYCSDGASVMMGAKKGCGVLLTGLNRWINHKLRAITKLLLNWKVLIIHLGNYAEDNTNKGEDQAKAKGIIRKLRQYKLLWYLHFMKDLLNEVAKISLLFQREDINISSAVTKLQSSMVILRNLMDNPGENQQFTGEIQGDEYREHTLLNVLQQATLEPERRRIIQELIDCLEARFENLHHDPLFLACRVFDHKTWPGIQDQQALLQYGAEDIKNLFQHFSVVLTNANCDQQEALSEWNDLKLHVSRNGHFRAVHPLGVWQRISQEDAGRNDYRNILTVIHITSLFPLFNASCERSFSTMKRIKSDWRCRLTTETLDRLIGISISGPKLNQFDPKPAVRRWWLDGEKKKRPATVPYGSKQ